MCVGDAFAGLQVQGEEVHARGQRSDVGQHDGGGEMQRVEERGGRQHVEACQGESVLGSV